jgi:hypothetical protein
MMVAMAS